MSYSQANQVLSTTLRRALSLRRPHGSKTEGQFLMSLIPTNAKAKYSWIDGGGNLHIDLRLKRNGQAEHLTRTLFVAHTDTVHRTGGVNGFIEHGDMWHAEPGNALGADDGAGVAILAAMIASGKPGYYIFTRGEEQGCIGSKYLRKEHVALLEQFDRAIAFDRKDTWSVITHQMNGRCCSETFANTLADELNQRGMLYMGDDTGVFTDTAEYTKLIPECTNLSAGYFDEHSDQERLDTAHVAGLFDAAMSIDWEALPTERKPHEPEPIVEWGTPGILGSGYWQATKGAGAHEFNPNDWKSKGESNGKKKRLRTYNPKPVTVTSTGWSSSGVQKQEVEPALRTFLQELLDSGGIDQEDVDRMSDPFFFDDNPDWGGRRK